MDTNQPVPAGYDRLGPKRRVDFRLNTELLERAAALTHDLPGTIEHLLAEFVRTTVPPVPNPDRVLAGVIAALNTHNEEHGFLSDAFADL